MVAGHSDHCKCSNGSQLDVCILHQQHHCQQTDATYTYVQHAMQNTLHSCGNNSDVFVDCHKNQT